MKFKNVPDTFQEGSLDARELAEAIKAWVTLHRPNIRIVSDVIGTVKFLTMELNQPLKKPDPITITSVDPAKPIAVSLESITPPPEKPVKATRKRAKKLNAGIGKPLTEITGDYRKHTETALYQKLKPDFPHLTYKALHLNLYNVDGLVHLGGGIWKLPKRPELGNLGTGPTAQA